MDRGQLTRELKRRALEEGFDSVGVARARSLQRDAGRLAAWLDRGHHAGMSWMARDPQRRADPRLLLDGCRSVVSLAMNYWPGEPGAQAATGQARVARYARGRDYHRVLGGKLKRLATWLEELTGEASRGFVDTAPLLERAWAERAGVGWIGKNANLLTREMGSWVLLGELLTAAALVPDPGPHEDHCGSCTACLDACPTGAIVADGVVDSGLCISYWTIEHRGAVALERRANLEDWIFGCDVCQEVCPWNHRFARPVAPPRFDRVEDLRGLDPEAILEMDESAFRARFSGTAIMRARWQGMRRNACIVLGIRGDRRSLAALADALEQEDSVLRGHAAWAIGAIGGPSARRVLRRAQRLERDGDVLDEIRRALASED